MKPGDESASQFRRKFKIGVAAPQLSGLNLDPFPVKITDLAGGDGGRERGARSGGRTWFARATISSAQRACRRCLDSNV